MKSLFLFTFWSQNYQLQLHFSREFFYRANLRLREEKKCLLLHDQLHTIQVGKAATPVDDHEKTVVASGMNDADSRGDLA